jgi:hypothetical protein
MVRKVVCLKDIDENSEFHVDAKVAARLTGSIFLDGEKLRLMLPIYKKGKIYEIGRPNIDIYPQIKEGYGVYLISLRAILKKSNLLDGYFMDLNEMRLEKIKKIYLIISWAMATQ